MEFPLSLSGRSIHVLVCGCRFFVSQASLIYEWGRSPIGDKFVSGNFNTTHTLTLADAIIHKLDLPRPRKPPPTPPPLLPSFCWLADSLLFIFLYYLGGWFTRALYCGYTHHWWRMDPLTVPPPPPKLHPPHHSAKQPFPPMCVCLFSGRTRHTVFHWQKGKSQESERLFGAVLA